MSKICYTPVKGIDDEIAKNIKGWSAHRVANLRGLYDSSHDVALDVSNTLEAAKTLLEYRRESINQEFQEVNKTLTSKNPFKEIANMYPQLHEVFTVKQLNDRKAFLSDLFSSCVTDLCMEYPQYSRMQIIKGVRMKDGTVLGGQFYIFDTMYDFIEKLWLQNKEEGLNEYAEQFENILKYWRGLVTLVRTRLRDTEKIRIGDKIDYIAEATDDNLSESINDAFDPESSTREAYQEENDKKSAYGSLSAEVKIALSYLRARDLNGEYVLDDLGMPTYLNPITAHQYLSSLLIGSTSEDQMVKILKGNVNNHPWIQELIEKLEEDPELKTKFYVNMHKGQQVYSATKVQIVNGIKKYITKTLNKLSDEPYNEYLTSVNLGNIQSEYSIFDADGNVVWENVASLKELLNKYHLITDNNTPLNDATQVSPLSPNNRDAGFTLEDKKKVLKDIFSRLGFNFSEESLAALTTRKNIYKVIKELSDINTYGLSQLEKLDPKDGSSVKLTKALTIKGENERESKLQEHLKKLNNIAYANSRGLRMERRCSYRSKDDRAEYDSYVNPCFMSDFFGRITSFVDNGDYTGLKKYIDSMYKKCPYFYSKEQGRYLTMWLQDLCNTNNHLFAENFTFSRFVGEIEGNVFEDFTSKQHAVALLQYYFAPSQISKGSKFIQVPTFILGDSGVTKFLTVKKYDANQILNGFYDTYLQERQRMLLAEATLKKLNPHAVDENGNIDISLVTKYIPNFTTNYNKYSLLTFLNDDFVSTDGTVGKYAQMIAEDDSSDNIKRAIKEYMKEYVAETKKKFTELGVFDTKTIKDKNGQEVEKFIDVNDVLTKENFDKQFAEFCWNEKFAMINQLQIMTVDPSFYKNTKDFQKRYKEIHAPGIGISVQAYDKYNGKLYSEDSIERCAYFEDIEVPAKEAFLNAAREYYGEDSSIYKKYLNSNTLTDGQGYRSLDSYRKVKGMAGQWSQEDEDAYRKIKALRSKYRPGEKISKEDFNEIAELATVFQPIKPYMFTFERLNINQDEEVMIPVQHKYAEIVLIPELMPDCRLKEIAYYMEENDIDMVGSTTIVKVGGFGAANIKYKTDEIGNFVDAEGNIIEGGKDNKDFDKLAVQLQSGEIKDALSKSMVHSLPYSDYRIQTNVPNHVSQIRQLGTQLRKLIMTNLNWTKGYERYLKGKKIVLKKREKPRKLSAQNLVAFYNSLNVANILDSFHQFAETVGDPSILSDKLIQNIINNGRESLDNLIAYSITGDDKFLIPIFEGGTEYSSSSTLFSVFKKIVNKQRINGGSAVQASSLGLTKEEDGSLEYVVDPRKPEMISPITGKPYHNILYAESELSWDAFVNIAGVDKPLNMSDWVDIETGELKLGEELSEDDPDYYEYLSYKDKDGKVHKPLIEESFPGILNIVAYRIPTEREYSMINVKIKRFSTKIGGGIIKVPPQGTTIAGFDFDIDKLYFIRKTFATRKLSEQDIADIWKKAYEEEAVEAQAAGRESILSKLIATRKAAEQRDEDVENLLSAIFSIPSEDQEGFFDVKNRLYKYWKEAGIEGTPKEFFSKYLEKHFSDYMETYDYDKTPLENSRVARDNMILHLIQERLKDPETFGRRYTPGGFENASKSARILRELVHGKLEGLFKDGKFSMQAMQERVADKNNKDPEPNYNPTDLLTLLTYNQQNQVAGKLIGVFADQNTNHAFSSLLHKFKCKAPISFAGHIYGDLLHAPEGVDIDLNMAEFLAASVDAVKDPVLNFLNLNTITADAGAFLARIGYSSLEVGLLFNQPIIKEVCEFSFNNGYNPNSVIKMLKDKYEDKAKEKGVIINSDNTANALSIDALVNSIVDMRKLQEDREVANSSESFYESGQNIQNQLVVLNLFQTILKSASDLADYVQSTKFTAANAVGSTFGHFYAQQMRTDKYIESLQNKDFAFEIELSSGVPTTIFNQEELLEMTDEEYMNEILNNPFGYEQAMYDMNRKAIKVLAKYFPYENQDYKDARRNLANLTSSQTLDDKTIDSMHEAMLTNILSNTENSYFNGNYPVKYKDEIIPARKYFLEYFPKQLFKITQDKTSPYHDMEISRYLQFITDENTGQIKISIQGSNSNQVATKDEIIESWEELNKVNPNVAQDLFFYGFFSSGFTFGPKSFMHYVPSTLKASINAYSYTDENDERQFVKYTDMLYDILEHDYTRVNQREFLRKYIRNNTSNPRFTKSPKGETLKYLQSIAKYPNRLAKPRFTVNRSDKDYASLGLEQRSTKDGIFFYPALIIDGNLYLADNPGEQFNYSNTGSIDYVRVSELGKSNMSANYTSDEGNFNVSETPQDGTTYIREDIAPSTEDNGQELRDALIGGIVDEMYNAMVKSNIRDEVGEFFTKDDLTQAFMHFNEAALTQQIEEIKNGMRDSDGILVLDEKGNIVKSC